MLASDEIRFAQFVRFQVCEGDFGGDAHAVDLAALLGLAGEAKVAVATPSPDLRDVADANTLTSLYRTLWANGRPNEYAWICYCCVVS